MTPIKPTLFVTLICKHSEESGALQVIRYLSRLETGGGFELHQSESEPNEWSNFDTTMLLSSFEHPEFPDLALVQLSMYLEGDVSTAWRTASEKLALAIDGLSVELLGRTLVYQARLPEKIEAEQQDEIVLSLLTKSRLRAGNGRRLTFALAASDVPGGRLWLLMTGTDHEETVYLTLGTEAQEERLKKSLLLGRHAALPWPDTIAHQVYFMARDYLADGLRERLQQTNQMLMGKSVKMLQQQKLLMTDSFNTFDLSQQEISRLSNQVAELTTVMTELNQLHKILEQYKIDFEQSMDGSGLHNSVGLYHRWQINTILKRVAQDMTDASAALQAANTAFNSLRAKMEQEKFWQEEKRIELEADAHDLTHTILAVVGVILAVGFIVSGDPDVMLWRAFAIIGAAAIATILLLVPGADEE